jgi:hypothetical protein
MSIFIYILASRIVIHCIESVGCMQTSLASFNAIFLGGAMELMFEIPWVVKIYRKKNRKIKKEE